MDTALLIARLLLAVVFAVAGFAKLADRSGSRQALEGFGLPATLAAPGAIILPLIEIAVAVALLPTGSAPWGGIAALVLLGAFVAAIAYNVARGRTPDCHCFGQIHSEPAGWSTLIRNGVLAGVAAFLIVGGWDDPGPSVVNWIGDLSSGERVAAVFAAIALVAIVAEGWLLVHLLSQNGRVLLRIDALESAIAAGVPAPAVAAAQAPAEPPRQGLPDGAPAPAFKLEGLHGETMTLDALRAAGKQVMLLFSDPGCGPCNALLPDLGKWQRDHGSRLTFALLSRGTAEANRAKSVEHGLTHVLLQKDREVSQAYQAHGTPSAVLVRPDGTIGSAVSAGAEAIRTLVARTTGTLSLSPTPVAPRPNGGAVVPPAQPAVAPPAPPRQSAGGPAPAVSLPDLAGETRTLADFRGDPTLVVFWNPGCGFCKRMAPEIQAWEANPPAGAPKLLIVSTGTVEANQEQGLKSTIVLDQGFNTGRAFGASGTPSAVLIDANGNIASDVAVGAPGVMALANGEDPKPAANGGAPQPKASKVGDPAPAIKLPDLEGKSFELSARRGSKQLVLFWNPGCGFCNRMLPDVKALEESPPKGAPKLVVVSTGTVEANKAMELKSVVVLDDGFNVGRAYGASGTPSAVLIDAKGNIASEIAVGAPAVLALAGVKQDQAQAAV